MTVPFWPSELLQTVYVDGYQSSPAGGRLGTSMEAGPDKQRRRGPKLRPLSGTIRLDPDERARFERFWDEEIDGGTLPFWFPDIHLGGFALATESGLVLTTETDRPVEIDSWWLVQMAKEDPAYSAVSGLLFNVSFKLVVLPI
jgi:hypothetical protein